MSIELNKEMLVPSMSALNEDKVYLISRAKATQPSIVPGYGYISDNGFEHDIGYSSDNGIVVFPKFGNIVGKRIYIIGSYKDKTKTTTSINLAHNQSGPPTTVIDLPVIGMDDDPDNILTYVDVLQDPIDINSVVLIGPVVDGSSVTTNRSTSHNKDIPLAMVYRSTTYNLYEIDHVGLRTLTYEESDTNKNAAGTDPFVSYVPVIIDLASIMTAVQSMNTTLATIASTLHSHSIKIAVMEGNIDYIRKGMSDMNSIEIGDAMKQLSNKMTDVIEGIKNNYNALTIDREKSDLHIISTDEFNVESMAILKEIKSMSVTASGSAKTDAQRLNTVLQVGTLFTVILGLLKDRR